MSFARFVPFPDISEATAALHYSRWFQRDSPRHWKCESFASLMTISAMFLILTAGIYIASLQDPSVALMTSSISDEPLCVELTCSALYCLFTQPDGCGVMPKFVQTDTTLEICASEKSNCDWTIEVLSNAGYDQRARTVYIANNETGMIKSFPQLDNLKIVYVTVEKYIDTRYDYQRVDWSLQAHIESKLMTSCTSFPQLDSNKRCGSYVVYLSNTIYDQQSKLHYTLIVSVIGLLTMLTMAAFPIMIGAFLDVYRWQADFKETLDPALHPD